MIVLLGVFPSVSLFGQEKDSDPEAYKLRMDGQFWYANPTATISGSSAQVPISFDKTFGFTDYSTFNANVDWHFKRKHHLFLAVSPNQITRTHVLQQAITFKDKTFLAGSSATGELRNYAFAPGYRYDIIHRPSGHLGVLIQIDRIDLRAAASRWSRYPVLFPQQTPVCRWKRERNVLLRLWKLRLHCGKGWVQLRPPCQRCRRVSIGKSPRNPWDKQSPRCSPNAEGPNRWPGVQLLATWQGDSTHRQHCQLDEPVFVQESGCT